MARSKAINSSVTAAVVALVVAQLFMPALAQDEETLTPPDAAVEEAERQEAETPDSSAQQTPPQRRTPDIFRPSEEIWADSDISFPVDI